MELKSFHNFPEKHRWHRSKAKRFTNQANNFTPMLKPFPIHICKILPYDLPWERAKTNWRFWSGCRRDAPKRFTNHANSFFSMLKSLPILICKILPYDLPWERSKTNWQFWSGCRNIRRATKFGGRKISPSVWVTRFSVIFGYQFLCKYLTKSY